MAGRSTTPRARRPSLMRPVVWARRRRVHRRRRDPHHRRRPLRRAGAPAATSGGSSPTTTSASGSPPGSSLPHAPVAALASFPALTVSEEFSQAAAFSRMIDRGVHHLVVLDSARCAAGILRAVDFASAEIRNPLLIRSQIESADSVPALRAAAELLKPTLVELTAAGRPPPRSATCSPRSSTRSCASWSPSTGSTRSTHRRPGSCWARWPVANRCPTPTSTPRWCGASPGRRGAPGPLRARRGAAGRHGVVRPGPVRRRRERGEPVVRPFQRGVGERRVAVAAGADRAAGPAAVVDRDRQPAAHRGRAGPDPDRRDAAAAAEHGLPARLHQGGHGGEAAQRLRPRVRRRPSGPPPRRAEPQARRPAAGRRAGPLGRRRDRRLAWRYARPVASR